jgi:hypothetical protein
MKARTFTWLVMMALLAPKAWAAETEESPLTLTPGDRVKVEIAGNRKSLRATIESVTGDDLVLRPEGGADAMRLNLSQLQTLDVARGRRSQWRKGAVIGFIPGALLFGLAGGVLPCIDTYSDCFAGGWAVTGALIGGGLTASVGALVGLAFKTDRWERVPTGRAKVSLILAPEKGGAQFGLAVSF